MTTMKKQAKAKAVEKGTFYECGWCGKEGTNAPCGSDVKKVVCGRMVEEGKNYFCSEKCQNIYCVESNRRILISDIDFANKILGDIKKIVTSFIKEGEKIPPLLLQLAKLLNIFKKVLTFVISGDKPSAQKLYDEKKEIVTDYTEDLLADKVWGDSYMVFINKFAILDEVIGDDVPI